MSRVFSTKFGSVESLNVSTRCGWRLKAFQMVFTLEREMPLAASIDRRLQCVASGGFSWSVLRTTSAIISCVIFFFTPGRGASRRPAMRCLRNRLRHLSTVCSRMPSSSPISAYVMSSRSSNRITRHRLASACGVLGRRATRSSSALSTLLSANGVRVLIVRVQDTLKSIRAAASNGCAIVQVRTLAMPHHAGSLLTARHHRSPRREFSSVRHCDAVHVPWSIGRRVPCHLWLEVRR